MATAITAGQRWLFKAPWRKDQYGAGATVVQVWTGVDRPHPGRIFHTFIDLDTDNGTQLRGWSPGELRYAAKPEVA